MHSIKLAFALLFAVLFFGAAARAGDPEPSAPASSSSAVGAPATQDPPPAGFGVLAREGATDAAWALAKALYARDGLRPTSVDEAHARVLAGEPAPKDGPDGGTAAKDLADLAETRAAIHGDDAPSRQLLASIATTYHLRGIVVVEMTPQMTAPPRPRARVFFVKSGFDAAEYAPDEQDAPVVAWGKTVRSLERAYGFAPPETIASPNATREVPPPVKPADTGKHFYTSPWFWGAVGAAVFAGGALYLATRDSDPSTIHLQVTVPK